MQTNHIFYPSVKQSAVEKLTTISLPDLYDKVYLPKLVLIKDFLYSGAYLFAGPPKIGKSFFMAQLAYHVATGTQLWNYPVKQAGVLYLSLEDNLARLQKRFSRMFGVDTNANLHLATNSKSLIGGLEWQLEEFLQAHQDTKLIIIDTLQKIRNLSSANYNYSQDYDILNKLHVLALQHNICIIVVHHTRKMEAEDRFDMISGTNGLLGAADAAMVLYKQKRTDRYAKLSVAGREQPDQLMTLEFQPQTCTWKFINVHQNICHEPFDSQLEQVASLVSEDMPIWQGTATQLLEELAITDSRPNTFTKKLNVKADKLFSDYDVLYTNKVTHSCRLITLQKLPKKTG